MQFQFVPCLGSVYTFMKELEELCPWICIDPAVARRHGYIGEERRSGVKLGVDALQPRQVPGDLCGVRLLNMVILLLMQHSEISAFLC